MSNTAITTVQDTGLAAGTEQSQGFGTKAMARAGETASAAVAAQARASVEARYVMAERNPRDIMTTRAKLLKACDRPGFAKSAIYSLPRGDKPIRGETIRFAEEAARALGNILCESVIAFDDAERQIVRVVVTDLESNLTYPQDIMVEKVVERSKLREGQQPMGTRVNSFGKMVFLVPATEDELLMKRNALTSKAIRTGILRILPGDIREEARARCEATAEKSTADDPESERKWVADAFADLGIMPDQIAEYLGHTLDRAVPAELVKLRQIGQGIAEGRGTWAQVLEAKGARATDAKPEASKAAQGVREKLDARKKDAPKVDTADAPPAREPGQD